MTHLFHSKLAFVVISCGKSSSESTFSALSREVYIEHAIPVEEVLTLEESGDVFFANIGSLATDSRGNIFVVDRQVNHVIRFNPEGELVATFGGPGEGPGEFRYMDRDMHLPRPFRRLSHYRVTDEALFYYAWNDSVRVQVYDMSGNLRNTIRYDIEYRKADMADFDFTRFPPEFRRFFEGAAPETKSAFDNLMVDDMGRVWVNLGDIADPETDQWIILNADSELESAFELPRRVRYFQVVGNRIFGIDRDEDGQQRIKVYAVG